MNMDIVIPSANYTIDASEKKIVLTYPYDSITAEQITSIRNITKNMLIYSASDPTKSGITIDPAGTINYNYDGAMEDTDIIRIEVDSTPIDVNITNISLLGQSDVLEVYSSESVPASSTTSSTGQDVRGASYVILYVKNATSTSLTVNVFASPDSAGTFKALIGTTTLNATTKTQDEIELDKVPNYLFFDLVNSDSTNAATVSISVQRG